MVLPIGPVPMPRNSRANISNGKSKAAWNTTCPQEARKPFARLDHFNVLRVDRCRRAHLPGVFVKRGQRPDIPDGLTPAGYRVAQTEFRDPTAGRRECRAASLTGSLALKVESTRVEVSHHASREDRPAFPQITLIRCQQNQVLRGASQTSACHVFRARQLPGTRDDAHQTVVVQGYPGPIGRCIKLDLNGLNR